MESSETVSSKKVPLEGLSRDELIKKCSNFLIIAKKAKQAKDESLEELKKYKENEIKLSSDVAALKEVVESFTKKQNEFAEVQNKHKITEEKNSELKRNLQKLEENYALKITECFKLQETLKKLSEKISVLEVSNSEYKEKISDFKENYSKLDIENKLNLKKLKEYELIENELKKKFRASEEKYIKLEMTLKEFQGKYIEECRNHEELQETLNKLQNRVSSGHCSSRSSDSLRLVYENQEYDEIVEKCNDLSEKNKQNICEIEKLNIKVHELENSVTEWSNKYHNLLKYSKEKSQNLDGKFDVKLDQVISTDGLVKDSNECQDVKTFKTVLQDENNKHIYIPETTTEELNKTKIRLNEVEALLNLKSLENKELMEKVVLLEQSLNEFKTDVNEITKENESQLQQAADKDDVVKELQETNDKFSAIIKEQSAMIEQQKIELNSEKEKFTRKCNEYQQLYLKIKEYEKSLNELKKKYECAILEKDKLIEICQSDKSAEEIFKQNTAQLNEELTILRKENIIADKKYKEMELKLEESRAISEMLRKEFDEKCDKYDAFTKEIDFYKSIMENLKKKVNEQEREYLISQNNLEKIEMSEGENIKTVEEPKMKFLSERDNLKIVDSKVQGILDENNLKRETKEQIFCSFDDIDIKNGEKYKDFLNKYIRDGNTIDSLSLVEDLINFLPEKASAKHEVVQNYTQTDIALFDNIHGNILNNKEKLTVEDKILREEEANETIEKSKDKMCSCGNENFKSKISSLAQAVEDIKYFKTLINKEVQECFASVKTDHAAIMIDIAKGIKEVFYNLQSGNSELLSEMNAMNKVLKERGEAISKLEQMNESQNEELQEVRSAMSHLNFTLLSKINKIKQYSEELEKFKILSESKENTIKELEEEISKLKGSDYNMECLSSSTLSKVDEAARLMDVEETFEERYSKLKKIASKLKKKVAEQQKELEDEKNKSIAKQEEFQATITNLQSQIKSLMNVQGEYNKLQDMFEEEKNQNDSLRKLLESANEEIEKKNQDLERLRKEKEKFLSDKVSFDNIKKKLSSQIMTLKASIDEEKNKQAKFEKEIEKIELEKTLKDKKLDEEKEKHKATTALFEKQKMEAKNLGVLKLEIAEYEKSVSDLEKKLANQDESIKELKNLLEKEKSQSKVYLDEISHLKAQLTKENERATEADNQMKKFNEESSNREVEFKEKVAEILNLRLMVEEKKKEVELLSLELAKISQEKLKVEEKCKNAEDQYSREVSSLFDTVASLQDSLNQRDLELGELKKNFEGYKVRAQSVLRQSQKEMNQSKQRDVMEELEQLRSTSDSLKTRLEESGLQMQKLVQENEVFQEEKARLYIRIQELKNSLLEMRNENHELKLTIQKQTENHNETLKLQKLQSETLAHCFQKKIEELETNHQVQLEELNKENNVLRQQFEKILNSDEKTNDKRDCYEMKRNQTGFIPVKSDKELLDVLLLEREECEGSESVDCVSPQSRNSTNLIPLDQLLSGSEHYEKMEDKRTVLDVHYLNEKLEKSQNRIKHLTELLSESETDCAKLQHLNDVLKEEIRRNQRNIEREQHAQNFEYLKNVVLKFISLHNVDERIRLVPVLNTILKLSPEEEILLSNAAKGITEQSSNRGWGSYLNIWPTTQ